MRSPGRSLRRRSPVTPGRCCRPSPSRCRRSVSTRSAEASRDGSPTRLPGSGRPPWTVGTSTSSTCPAKQGLLGQVEGRTAQAVIDWLADRDQAWRDAVQYVAIDMCTIFKSAIRRVLPQATLVVDHFHLVQLANQTLTEVRRRVTVTHRGGAAARATASGNCATGSPAPPPGCAASTSTLSSTSCPTCPG